MLELEKVSFSYSPESRDEMQWAVNDVSLTIGLGEIVGIAGPTGSGKSTLAQIISGLAQPQRGRVVLNGAKAQDAKGSLAVRRAAGMVFQYPERQLFCASVLEDVAFGPKNQGASPQEAQAVARRALEQVGLDADGIGQASPFRLSGGQQRKVALAGVLAMQPKILVLDEPAAGLDPAGHADLLDLIRTLHDRDGITVVMVSHFMEDLASCRDRIIALNRGSVFAQGTPHEVFADADALESIGLAAPHEQAFAQKMKKAGMTLPSDGCILGIESLADAIAAFLAGEAPAR